MVSSLHEEPPTVSTGNADAIGVDAFRRALEGGVQGPVRRGPPEADVFRHLPAPESHSDFSALSETQYGKL